MNEIKVPIPARLKNVAVGGHVAGTGDIIDDVLNKNQEEINSEAISRFEQITGGSTDSIASLKQSINVEKQRALNVENLINNEIEEINQFNNNLNNINQLVSNSISNLLTEDGRLQDSLVNKHLMLNLKIEDEKNRAINEENSLNNRISDFETLEQFLIEGENLEIASSEDFNNPNEQQRVKIPTVGSVLDWSRQSYIENPEWAYVYIDNSNNIVFGIKSDGSIEWNKGIPAPVRRYVEQRIISNILNIDEFIGNLIDEDLSLQDLLNTKVDKEPNKSIVPTQYFNETNNLEWAKIITDSNNNILWGIKSDGSVDWYKGIPKHLKDYIQNQQKLEVVEIKNDEWSFIYTDINDNILWGIKTDGSIYPQQKNTTEIQKLTGTSYYPTDWNSGLFKLEDLGVGFFGVDHPYGGMGIELENYIPILKDVNSNIARNDFISSGDYNTLQLYIEYNITKHDLKVYLYRSNGIDVLPIHYPTEWYKNSLTKNLTFDEYLEVEAQIVEGWYSRYNKNFLYAPEGEEPVICDLKFIELINEWDLNCWKATKLAFNWTGLYDNSLPVYDFNTGVRNLFKYYKKMYQTVRNVNPDIKIVMGGVGNVFSNEFRALFEYDEDPDGYRIWDFFDIFNYHTYEPSSGVYNMLKTIYNILCDYTGGKTILKDKPVVITEYGTNNYDYSNDYAIKEYIKKTIILLASGNTWCMPYRLDDFNFDMRNGVYETTEWYYGFLSHSGYYKNSTISFLRNDGTDKAITNGDALERVLISRSDVQMLVKSSNIVNRLKQDGLLIKGAGYTITKVTITSKSNPNQDLEVIYEGTRQFPSTGGSLAINSDKFSNIAIDDIVKVYVSGNTISTDYKFQPKQGYYYWKFFESMLGKYPHNINIYNNGSLFIATWKDKNNQTIHALWASDPTNITITTQNKYPEIYNYRGELIQMSKTLTISDEILFIKRCGILTIN